MLHLSPRQDALSVVNCPDGEIGKRCGLRSRWSKILESSSLSSGTLNRFILFFGKTETCRSLVCRFFYGFSMGTDSGLYVMVKGFSLIYLPHLYVKSNLQLQ